MQWRQAVLALLLGLVCGALIGVGRQLHGREAGLHTNALVSLGAAAFVSVSSMLDADPGHMAAQRGFAGDKHGGENPVFGRSRR